MLSNLLSLFHSLTISCVYVGPSLLNLSSTVFSFYRDVCVVLLLWL